TVRIGFLERLAKAISSADARGLMQILPDTASEIAGDLNKKYYNLFKSKDNIQFGTWYIWKMLNYFKGDLELAISAYNCGFVCVERVRSGQYDAYPKQTIDYKKSILEWRHRFQNLGVD
ncbi:MAG: transglycosylase SLT domain-containing protein, partial [Nanoarchaeota archaeon]